MSPQSIPPTVPSPESEHHLALPQGLALPPKLSEKLATIVEGFKDHPVSFRELYQVTEDGAFSLILILLNLPYIIPIPFPGLSTITGVITAIIGARMALRKKPWLPRRLLDAKLPARFLPTLLKGTIKILSVCERHLKPRLRFVHEGLIFHHLNGVAIALCGVMLLMPIPPPVPLTNFFPGVAVLLIAAGTMERDGVFVLVGYAIFAISVAYFAFLAFGGIFLFDQLFQQLRAWWA